MEISTKEALAELKQELINEMWGGLNPTPDITNKSVHTVWRGSAVHTPFTVPEDGWIVDVTAVSSYGSASWKVNGVRAFCKDKIVSSATPATFSGKVVTVPFIPYPVKKGDIVDTESQYLDPVTCTFAPCRGNSAKTN